MARETGQRTRSHRARNTFLCAMRHDRTSDLLPAKALRVTGSTQAPKQIKKTRINPSLFNLALTAGLEPDVSTTRLIGSLYTSLHLLIVKLTAV